MATCGFKTLVKTFNLHTYGFLSVDQRAYQKSVELQSESDYFFFFSIDKELVHQLLFCFVTSNSTLLISRVFQAGHFKQLSKTFVCLRNIFMMSYASTYNLSLVFRLTLNLFSFGSFSLLDLSGLSCSLPDKGQFFRQKAPSNLLILLRFWPKWQKFNIKCNC